MAGIAGHTHSRVLVGFFALVFGLSWTLWVPLVILRDAVPGPLGFTLLLVGSLVPSGLAIFLAGLAGGKAALRQLLVRLVSWRVHAAWYLILLVPWSPSLPSPSTPSPGAVRRLLSACPWSQRPRWSPSRSFPAVRSVKRSAGAGTRSLACSHAELHCGPVSSLACSPRCGTFRCGCAAHPRTR